MKPGFLTVFKFPVHLCIPWGLYTIQDTLNYTKCFLIKHFLYFLIISLYLSKLLMVCSRKEGGGYKAFKNNTNR